MNRMITVCTGHRCGALLEQSCAEALPSLRSAVRASDQTVLVSTGCLGACAQAPVVMVSGGVRTADGPSGGPTRLAVRQTTWLGPVGPAQVQELCAWVAEAAGQPFPQPLAEAVFGVVTP